MSKFSKNIKWYLLGVLCICFVVLAICINLDSFKSFDLMMYNFVKKIDFENYFRYVTEFGDVFVFLIIILFVFSLTKNKNKTILLSLNLSGIALLNFILKNIFTRERPAGVASIVESGFSFPSGHSAVSAAFYIYLSYILIKNIDKKWIKCIIKVIISILVLSIGISRVYLGVHYFSDVLAGFSVGLIYTILFINFTSKVKFNEKKSKKNNEKNKNT